MQNTLQEIIKEIIYEDLEAWQFPTLSSFSSRKKLFPYQVEALKNIIKVLYLYFEKCSENNNFQNFKKNKKFEKNKKNLLQKYKLKFPEIEKNLNLLEYEKKKINPKYSFFENYFPSQEINREQQINISNFLNRACFWMATGSGKSLVLIKTIEILDSLMNLKLIPKKEIMVLLPRDDLILQFRKEIAEFNKFQENNQKQIEIINLKDYEEQQRNPTFSHRIKVYFYRSDLIRRERKENFIDYKSYENHGNWYLFLDEAHRGEKKNSLMQENIAALSSNGFLFNFSATFTEDLDKITTCFNFNLEKFIQEGYGKNIYLNEATFEKFNKQKDDLSQRQKQKQVLKSLIVFSLVKQEKINLARKGEKKYHYPLLMTLVHSVNTQDSDLSLFFHELEKIAQLKIAENILKEAKQELKNDFYNNKLYFFSKQNSQEKLNFNLQKIEQLQQEDILECVFNSRAEGKIEILKGESGKEIALKLQTSDKPFALIKIGDTKKFQREKLGVNYQVIENFEKRKFFAKINEDENINLLLGSRSFYEGWDSNRPNVLNMINIGKGDAKKFVLQGIGRGIRIEPQKGQRKRLEVGDNNKNSLLETLFIFATDKKSVSAILEELNHQKEKLDYQEISLQENLKKPFDLLIPIYKAKKEKENPPKFNIADESLRRFKNYFSLLTTQTLLLKYNLTLKKALFLKSKIADESFFQEKSENIYSNMNALLEMVISHLALKKQEVDKVKKLENEIIHFKHVKVKLNDKEIIESKIQNVENHEESEEEIKKKFEEEEINLDQYTEKIKSLGKNKKEEEIQYLNIKIKNLTNHYYLPVIYSTSEKQNYIKNIIQVKSEVEFIENLEKCISEKEIKKQWMFSKVQENVDKFFIPYYCGEQHKYRKFFPDFIFWLKAKESENYQIIFVDPKGTKNTDYQTKIAGFEKLFLHEGKPIKFQCQNFKVTFDLKFIAKDMNSIEGNKYQDYWEGQKEFNFLQ